MTDEEFIDHIALTTLVESLCKVTHPMYLPQASKLAYIAYSTANCMLEQRNKLLKELTDQKVKASTDLTRLNLTNRTMLALMAENIYTVNQLTQCTEHRLILTPNLGKKSLQEIKDGLAAKGLKLKDE